MDAVIYCRVSDPRQARGVSLAVQQQDCERLAEAHGDTIVRVLVDPGVSGKSLDRRAMQELLALLEADGAGAVYVWDIDRFSRDLLDQVSVARALIDRGQRLLSVNQNVDYSTPVGRLHLHITASVAQYEREHTVQRVIAAQQEKIARGEPLGPPAYGYAIVDKALVVDEAEAAIVRLVYRMYNAGSSLRPIARHLNDIGAPQRYGGRTWTPSHIRNMLSNTAYIGLLNWGEHQYEGNHEPLISREVWRHAQARQQRRSRVHPRTLDRTLSCCFECGECGGRVVAVSSQGRRYYLCGEQRREPGRHHVERVVSASEAAANAVVWAHVRELFSGGDVEAGADALSEQMRSEAARSHRQELAEELVAVEARIRRNLEAYHAGAIDVALLAEENEPLQAQQAKLEAALEREAAMMEGPSPGALRRLTRGSIDAALSTENVDRQQQLLELLFWPIEIGADRTLTIRARWPAEPVTYALPRYYSPQRGCLFELANLRLR